MGIIKKGKIIFDNARGLVGAVPQGFEMEMEEDPSKELPEKTNFDAGKVLAVKNKDEVEWKKVEAVPTSTTSDEGKVLTVDNEGKPGWAQPTAGGIQLYKHDIEVKGSLDNNHVIIVTTESTELLGVALITDLYYSKKPVFVNYEFDIVSGTINPFTGCASEQVASYGSSFNINPDSEVLSDTVTAL